jgi:hypothetical protein
MTRRRLTIFMLVAVTVSGALTGVHGNEGRHKCPMMGMSDCCEKAGLQAATPQVSAARLCCALNCTEPGTTNPTGAFNVSPSLSLAAHSGVVPPAVAASPYALPHHAYSSPSPPKDSHPAYIRHLALLI